MQFRLLNYRIFVQIIVLNFENRLEAIISVVFNTPEIRKREISKCKSVI